MEQEEWVQVWCEADTHRALLTPIAREFMTPLVPCHGYSSLSALHESALKINARFEETGQRSHILWAGDHDPSGVDLSRHLHKRLVEVHMHPAACVVERIALTEQQIRTHDPPLLTRPPKEGDKRAKWYLREFGDLGCFELDSMLVPELVAIVRAKIEAGITDRQSWDSRAARDRQMRQFLVNFVEEYRDEIDAGPTDDDEEDD